MTSDLIERACIPPFYNAIMAEEIENLSVDCFNPFIYNLLVNSFET